MNIQPNWTRSPWIETIIIGDPAKTANPRNAESAVAGIAIDHRANAYYVRDISHGFWHPNEFYDEIFNMADRLNARTVGIEITGLNEFISYPFINEMNRRGKFLSFQELKARGGSATESGKDQRIKSLIPFYRMGLIYHNDSGCCAPLEAQLLAFPRSKRKDVMDAVAYFVEMMQLGERYLKPSFTGPDESYETAYEQMRKTQAPSLNFRGVV